MNTDQKDGSRLIGEAPFKRSVINQVLLALLANVCSCFGGMDLAVSAVILPFLQNLSKEQTSWLTSATLLAAPVGGVFAGSLADRFGRKNALFWFSVICCIGWSFHTAAFYSTNYQLAILLLSRIIIGFSTGLRSGTPTVYSAEISSPHLRGVFCSWQSVCFASGVLLLYILAFMAKSNWGLIGTITAGLSLILAIIIKLSLPETPMWLASKKRYVEAEDNMCKIFGTKVCVPEITKEMENLKKQQNIKVDKSLIERLVQQLRYLMKPNILKPFCLIVILFLFQAFSGIFVILCYVIDICKNSGITINQYWSIILIGISRLVGTILSSFLSKKFGRKPLITTSGVGIAISMISLAGYITMTQQIKILPHLSSSIPLILILFYFLISCVGMATTPFILNAEIFPTKIRATASGLSLFLNFLVNFVLSKVFKDMIELLGYHGLMFLFGVVALSSAFFVWWFIPETKDKTLAEIEYYFESKSNVENVSN